MYGAEQNESECRCSMLLLYVLSLKAFRTFFTFRKIGENKLVDIWKLIALKNPNKK